MDPDSIDYTDDGLKNHDTSDLKTLVRLIRDILHEEGRVTNYDLLEEHDLIKKLNQNDVTWSKSHIRNNILPALRNTLEGQGQITVEKESAERGNFEKKIWTLPTGDDQ